MVNTEISIEDLVEQLYNKLIESNGHNSDCECRSCELRQLFDFKETLEEMVNANNKYTKS